jgi:hypothetical protein
MKHFILALGLSIFSLWSFAADERPVETMKSAAEKATLVVELAEKGKYGRLSRTRINMLTEARNRIIALADEHETFEQMDAREQGVFVHARERLNRLTQADNKRRMVCKRVARIGTRVTDAECLTVEQREARADGSAERTDMIQRSGCLGGGPACSGGG